MKTLALLAALLIPALTPASPELQMQEGWTEENMEAVFQGCAATLAPIPPKLLPFAEYLCNCITVGVVTELSPADFFTNTPSAKATKTVEGIIDTCTSAAVSKFGLKSKPKSTTESINWSTEFKTDQKEWIWNQLTRRGIPPAAANHLAQCMVDKAEEAYPDQKAFDAYINDGKPDDGMAERHARECVEKFQGAAPTPPKPEVKGEIDL